MTKIEWATLGLPKGVTWNPIRARNSATSKRGWHCEKVSPACEHCYAEALNAKAGDTGGTGLPYKPGHRQNGDTEIYLDEKTLLQPLSWRAPRGVFVCSMTDIFGDWVKDEWLDRIFAVMALCPQHRFALLTKRPARMREYFRERSESVTPDAITEAASDIAWSFKRGLQGCAGLAGRPLPNVWLGVTAEDQARADERIPDLLATPAAVRFVSIEPMLGPIDFSCTWNGEDALSSECWGDCNWCKAGFPPLYNCASGRQSVAEIHKGRSGLDWVICGGESGPCARPMHPDWARSLREQCKAAGVAFFFKQWGRWEIAEELGSREEGTNFWRFPDGDEFHIVSDGHDIVLCAAEDAKTPKKVWRGYWGDGHGHIAKTGKAGRLLDGKEYSEFPEARS